MRIVWFTPLHRDSAIGEFSVNVAEALAEEHKVELWCTDAARVRRSTSLPVVTYGVLLEAHAGLSSADVVIYNIGNHPWHAPMLPFMARHPGVVILHDLVLQHLISQLLVDENRDPELYVALMTQHYGEAGRSVARHAIASPEARVTEDLALMQDFPLFEAGIERAIGVVTHSHWQHELVRRTRLAPVRRLFHPSYATDLEPSKLALPDVAGDRCLLLALGAVTPNKRIDHLVEVLGRCPDLRKRVLLAVIGDAEERAPHVARLRQRIAELGLQQTVILRGRESDEVTAAWLARADVFVNLRLPPTEGASGSLMRQLPRGKPVIVYDIGGFSDLPNEAAVKVEAGSLDGLERALRELLDDPGRQRSVGQAGAAYAATLTVERYVADLVAFLEQELPRALLWRACDRVGEALGTLSVDAQDGVFDVVRHELLALSPPGGEPTASSAHH